MFLGTYVEDRCRGSWCAQRGTWRASNGTGTRVFGRGAVPHARPVRVVRGDVREEQAWPLRRFGAMRWRNGEAEAEQRREKVKKKGAQCPNRWGPPVSGRRQRTGHAGGSKLGGWAIGPARCDNPCFRK